MTRQKDIPQVRNPPGGDGHYVTYRDMTPSELVKREARQLKYEAMLARQAAYEKERWTPVDRTPRSVTGSVFAKCCKLPDGVVDYTNPNGYVPADQIKQYGDLVWLGGRRATMKHTVMGVVYGEDFASYEIQLPIESKDLAKIMNWVKAEEYLYDYQLDEVQIEALEEMCSIELPRNLVLFLTSSAN